MVYQYFLTDLLLLILAVTYKVDAQAPQGFITLDCGLPAGRSYVDNETGIEYISDAAFIDSGVIRTISPEINAPKPWLQTLRSFPEGSRNCYNFKVETGTQYLIRATFLHGFYDGHNYVEFKLYIGNKIWDVVRNPFYEPVSKEIIHVTTMNYLFICLKNMGSYISFISTLELRPMKFGPYAMDLGSLRIIARSNFGSTNGEVIRFPDDAFDRVWEPISDREWEPLSSANWTNINTTKAVDPPGDTFPYQPPSNVLRTAASPTISDELNFYIVFDNGTRLHLRLYFAELENLKPNQSRIFVTRSSQSFNSSPLRPTYLKTGIAEYSETTNSTTYTVSLIKTADSTLPPIINAVEVYNPVDLAQSESDQAEVDAMMNIKLTYGVKRNWQGDPCVPEENLWDGVDCSYNSFDGVPKITVLDLSSSGLVGAIASDISNLTLLETLDLSKNGLTGPVPEYLAHMPSLKVLNIAYNKLNGTIPHALIEKSKSNLLHLRYEGNPDLCESASCKKRKGPFVFLVLVSTAAAVIVAIVAIFRFGVRIIPRRVTRKKQGLISSAQFLTKWKKGRFTYAQLLSITNNLKVVLAQGGSGTVYHGYLHGIPVAVKILSSSSAQSYRQFQAEVDILLRVHHGNLLSLIGYCDESSKVGLIYEYMANGNLQEYILGDKRDTLSWEKRLKISLGAAQGLEYLHHGCHPHIVHRDVKTANILLNEKLEAKLADFGLSRKLPVTGGSHVFTEVVGTFGYFDPEYFRSRQFTTKSDVYSFGVVLLEIITGNPVVNETKGMAHLSQWVALMLVEGEVASVIDPKLGVDFDANSVSKAVRLAMTCVSETSSERPTMHQVVIELTDCLAMELSRRNGEPEVESKGSLEP